MWSLDPSFFLAGGIERWINLILNPSHSLLIRPEERGKFTIFAVVVMTQVWAARNSLLHDTRMTGAVNLKELSHHIKVLALEHQ